MGWAQGAMGAYEIVLILHDKGIDGLTNEDYYTIGKDLVDVGAVFATGWVSVGVGAIGLGIAIYEMK